MNGYRRQGPVVDCDYRAIIDGYVECALWASSDVVDGRDVELDSVDASIADETLAEMRRDVIAFVEGCQSERADCFEVWNNGQIGHDFWLTRNGHGTGFWDRGHGELGDWLTVQSKPYGDYDLYLGDDGKIYGQ